MDGQLELVLDGVSRGFDGRTYRDRLDRERLENSLLKVAWLMLDGRWHSLTEIRQIAPSADSRLRDLRKEKFGGFTIERKRASDLWPNAKHERSGLHFYRMVNVTRAQVALLFEGDRSLLLSAGLARKIENQPGEASSDQREEAAA